jgi:hypothetical protein
MICTFLLPALLSLTLPARSTATAPVPTMNSSQTSGAVSSVSLDWQPAVCYKMRTYIFERNDGDALKFVRETTCGPVRPRVIRSKMPKAKFVPTK